MEPPNELCIPTKQHNTPSARMDNITIEMIYIYIYIFGHILLRPKLCPCGDINNPYKSGTVTKVGNAQRVAANQTELQTHGTKPLVRVPTRDRIGTC